MKTQSKSQYRPPRKVSTPFVSQWDPDWAAAAKTSGLMPTSYQFIGPTVVEFGRCMEDISLMLEDCACPVPWREVLNSQSVRDSTSEGTIIDWCLSYLVSAGHVACDHEPGFGATYCSVTPFRMRLHILQGGRSQASEPAPTARPERSHTAG